MSDEKIVGQNKQQSNLSVSVHVMLLRQGDLMTYYSLENFFGYHGTLGKILFNVLMSLLDRFVALSLRGGGERMGLGWS